MAKSIFKLNSLVSSFTSNQYDPILHLWDQNRYDGTLSFRLISGLISNVDLATIATGYSIFCTHNELIVDGAAITLPINFSLNLNDPKMKFSVERNGTAIGIGDIRDLRNGDKYAKITIDIKTYPLGIGYKTDLSGYYVYLTVNENASITFG